MRQETQAKAPPTVVFMTDFGVVDDSVALCKGVMYSIAPELRVVDLTHQVTPFSISGRGAISLWGDAVFSGGDGVRGGYRSGGGEHTQSDRGEVEARTVFCAARQRADDAGAGSRWNRGGAGDYESRVDDWRGVVVHVSWAGHFFAGGGASGARRGLDQGGSGGGGKPAGPAGSYALRGWTKAG